MLPYTDDYKNKIKADERFIEAKLITDLKTYDKTNIKDIVYRSSISTGDSLVLGSTNMSDIEVNFNSIENFTENQKIKLQMGVANQKPPYFNLIKNGDFSKGGEGWEILHPEQLKSDGYEFVKDNDYLELLKIIEVAKGKTYTLLVDFEGYIYVNPNLKNSSMWTYWKTIPINTPTRSYKKITFTIPSDYSYDTIRVQFFRYQTPINKSKLYSITLVEGDVNIDGYQVHESEFNSGEFKDLGEFFVSSIMVDKNLKTTKIKACDKMMYLNEQFKTSLTYPARIIDVVKEISTYFGITVNENYISYKLVDKPPEKTTYREMLSYMAQINNAYVTFNSKGELEFRRLNQTTSEILYKSQYYLNGLVTDDVLYKVTGILCDLKRDKEVLVVGSAIGNQIELSNPLMTQSYLNEIYNDLKTLSFKPYTLEWRGDPCYEVGDFIQIEDADGTFIGVPILNQTLTFNGGLKSTISADVKGSTSTSYQYKGTLQRQIEFLDAKVGADGNLIYGGDTQPPNPKEGDTWFKPNGAYTDLMKYENGVWVKKVSTGNTEKIITEITDDGVLTQNLTTAIAKIIDLDASRITSGYISADRINSQSISQTVKDDITAGTVKETTYNQFLVENGQFKSEINTTIDKLNGEDVTLRSLINQTDKKIDLMAQNIDLTGYVKFSDLKLNDGTTEINGGNIKTGKITSADGKFFIDLDNKTLFMGEDLNNFALKYENGKLTFGDGTFTTENLSPGLIEELKPEGFKWNEIVGGGKTYTTNLATRGEFLNTQIDLSPAIDKYGLDTEYTLSFDLSSKDPSKNNSIQLYTYPGDPPQSKYKFIYYSIDGVTTTPKRYKFSFKPTLNDPRTKESTELVLYGTYDTGNVPIISNIMLEVGGDGNGVFSPHISETKPQSSYLHIRYADDSSSVGAMYTTPTNSSGISYKYIGTAVTSTTGAPTNKSDYKWTKFVGEDGKDGVNGVPGTPGKDGQTPYFHTAWALSADGTQGFSTSESLNKLYMGTYTDYIQTDSTDPKKYKWVLIKGSDGVDGASFSNSNIIKNGDFKSGTKYWEMKYPEKLGNGYYNFGTISIDNAVIQKIKLKPNTTYTVMFDFEGQLGFRMWYYNGTTRSYMWSTSNNDLRSDTRAKKSIKFTTPTTPSTNNLYEFDMFDRALVTGEIETKLYSITMVEGDKVISEFIPNTEEMINDLVVLPKALEEWNNKSVQIGGKYVYTPELFVSTNSKVTDSTKTGVYMGSGLTVGGANVSGLVNINNNRIVKLERPDGSGYIGVDDGNRLSWGTDGVVRINSKAYSSYATLNGGGLYIYNSSEYSSNLRTKFDSEGEHFYRDGYYVGKIGTNTLSSDSTKKGLVFDLEYNGAYMTWATMENPTDNTYKMKWSYSKTSFDYYSANTLNAGCDIDMHNYTLRNVRFEDGGITGTLRFVQVNTMNSDGRVNNWNTGCYMVFKNGLLVEGNWAQ